MMFWIKCSYPSIQFTSDMTDALCPGKKCYTAKKNEVFILPRDILIKSFYVLCFFHFKLLFSLCVEISDFFFQRLIGYSSSFNFKC